MKTLLCCLFILMDAGSSSYSQTIQSKGPFVLNFDYARFRNDSTSTYLEVYYSFYAGSISFTPADTGYRGAVMLTTVIRRKSDGDTLVLQRRKLPILVADTSEATRRLVFVEQSGFPLPHDEYVLEVFAADFLDPAKKDSIRLPLTLTRYADGVVGSDIELCSEVRDAAGTPTAFTKNSLDVVPNPSLVFGAGTYPVLFHYVELYNLDTAMVYLVTAQVLDPKTETVMRTDQRKKHYTGRNSVEAGHSNVGSIKSGRYYYRLTLSDTIGHRYFQTEKKFYLDNPHIKRVQSPGATTNVRDLVVMVADELADEFRKAKYVATNAEIKTFAEIKSAEGRRTFLAKFWSEIEKDRPPLFGIRRADYLQRIGEANKRFRTTSREGWQSDRGRVFVLYGDPDEIERYPSTGEAKPYEIWHYYKIENGVEFDFVDRSGFGDYILLNSTKRGETQDAQWQRFLH